MATSRLDTRSRPAETPGASAAPGAGGAPARSTTAAATAPAPLSEQLRRGDLMAAACPSREVLRHVTSRWGVLVLMSLEGGTRRFGELRRMIGGVSERMLAQTLQWLEGDGLVDRVAHAVVPPHVEYSLTPLGREAAERVRALADWIETSLPRVSEHWGQADDGGNARTNAERERPVRAPGGS